MGLGQAETDAQSNFDTEQAAGEPEAACPLDDIEVTLLWQEFHEHAPAGKYTGPEADDKKVVERKNDSGQLQSKPRLHLCFMEKAVTTAEIKIKKGTFYGWWRIVDENDTVLREHPQLSKANFDKKAAGAKLKDSALGWTWDGRDPKNPKKPVFAPPGTYRSVFTAKSDACEKERETAIALEGEPYHVFIAGIPKHDAELKAEFDRPALEGRFLGKGDKIGQRTARDCWIIAQRGEEHDPGHMVFLGQGTIEAHYFTGNEGAIATPHGREYKGWIRPDPHVAEYGDAKPDRVQIEDLGRTDGEIMLLGSPPPKNPNNGYKTSKAGVQAHEGAVEWTSNGLSIGCTTFSRISGATEANPGSIFRGMRSLDSKFGSWGSPEEPGDLKDGGPVFTNKQSKRATPEDALATDDHQPSLVPAAESSLHMQLIMQRGVFGGFKGHEVPQSSAVADEPAHQIRIRMVLEEYLAGSLYYAYHHAIAFGHTWEKSADTFEITLWVPFKVIRGWNGNFRNVKVSGNCQIEWAIERRLRAGEMGPVPIVQALHPVGKKAGTFAELPELGRLKKTWTPGKDLAPGTYVSVFRYQLELFPYTKDADAWVPESAMTDVFSGLRQTGWAGTPASIGAESLKTDGTHQYLQGISELVVLTVPDPPTPT